MNYRWRLYLLPSLLVFTIGCEDKEVTEEPNINSTISTPTEYEFDSRFNEGSSVSYSGQTVRNMLLTDLKTMTDYPGSEIGHPIALINMTNIYDYSDDLDLTSWMSTTPSPLERNYSNISTGKNLSGKTDSGLIHGYDKTADELVREWMQNIATNCENYDNVASYLAITSSEGLNLSQMINKTLLGAVSYSQGTSNYLGGLSDDDNLEPKSEADAYTEMEHHWDESFGYFGAARDYNTGYVDDEDKKNDPYYDSNADGSIDFKSEYNFGFSVNAAKRDLGAADGLVDFTKVIFDAYLEGRTLIHNQAPLDEILVQRDIIVNNWEKVIASTVVHYVNDVVSDMVALYQADTTAGPLSIASATLNIHWAEMRGFTIALQYNDMKLISDADLITLAITMGKGPVYPESGETEFYTYHGQLLSTVKTILQNAYGFSDANMDDW